MFTFISYWRTAAVVLCDLSSTAYYIGAIVESSIGKAAPWFILAVHAVQLRHALGLHRKLLPVRARRRLRVVKEALGGFLAKLSVSALLFDSCLTGPISSVSAGQYIMGLAVEILGEAAGSVKADESKDAEKKLGLGVHRLSPSPSTSFGRT